MHFLLEAKGLNDNGYFLLINLTQMIGLTISQIEHLIKLDFKLPPSEIS